METVITKFMRMMEIRSVRMMRLVKEFAEQYRKENHLHVELTNRSMTPMYYNLHNLQCMIYNEAEINEYDSGGRGHQLLRLVNSNLNKIINVLSEILRYWSLDDGSEIEKQVIELSKLLGVQDPDSRKLLDPAFLQALLSRASDMMDGPIKFFDGAGCYSISGMTGTSKYMDKLNESRFALFNENEYKIAKAFFEYLEQKHI